jgi:hypothetical protein
MSLAADILLGYFMLYKQPQWFHKGNEKFREAYLRGHPSLIKKGGGMYERESHACCVEEIVTDTNPLMSCGVTEPTTIRSLLFILRQVDKRDRGGYDVSCPHLVNCIRAITGYVRAIQEGRMDPRDVLAQLSDHPPIFICVLVIQCLLGMRSSNKHVDQGQRIIVNRVIDLLQKGEQEDNDSLSEYPSLSMERLCYFIVLATLCRLYLDAKKNKCTSKTHITKTKFGSFP